MPRIDREEGKVAAEPILAAVPVAPAHTLLDLHAREYRPCPVPGPHLVFAVPDDDVLTCYNDLPLQRRSLRSHDNTCYAQVPLGPDGPPELCPNCRRPFVI